MKDQYYSETHRIQILLNAMFMSSIKVHEVFDLLRTHTRPALSCPGNPGSRMYKRVEQVNKRIKRAHGE